MTEALKPCPFCGGEAAVERRMLTGSYRVLCKSCLSGTDWLGQVMDCPTPPWVRLASRWNARAEPHVSETGKIEHDARDVLTEKLVEAVRLALDRGVVWRNEIEREFQMPLHNYIALCAALAEYEARG